MLIGWKFGDPTTGLTGGSIGMSKKTCGRPFNGHIQINADGKMMVCCFDFDGKLTVGDTYKDSIADILKGDKFNEIREKHKTGDHTGTVCEKCDQLNENDHPLIYSSRDPDREIGKTSSTKFKLKE
jgi:radical SAM protein with 4Fe4S-binding SPASM domain